MTTIRTAVCRRCKGRVPTDQNGRLWAHGDGVPGREIRLCGHPFGGGR